MKTETSLRSKLDAGEGNKINIDMWEPINFKVDVPNST